MCRATALAYIRLKTCSLHWCGYSIKYGSAITAYQAGLDAISTVSDWCSNVLESPEANR